MLPGVPRVAGGSGARAPASGRFIAGDPLRALAALAVVVFHVANGFAGGADRTGDFIAAYGHPAGRLLQAGRLGVSIFFVLSGYLLSRPFLRALVYDLPGPPLRVYLRNRALRIVPAFWVVCALTLLWFGTHGARPLAVAAIFGFTQTYEPSAATVPLAHAWTLDVEVAYYLLLPLAAVAIAAVVRRRGDAGRRLALLALLLTVAAAASLLADSRISGASRWFLTLGPQLWAFIPGIALAGLEISIGGRVRRWSWARATPIMCLAGVALLVGWGARDGVSPLRQALATAGGAGLIVGSALVLQWARGGCWKILDTAPLRVLGRWSYGIYLVHLPLGYALLPGLAVGQRPSVRLALGLPLLLSATLLAAAVSYYLIERPALRFRARGAELFATGHAPALASDAP